MAHEDPDDAPKADSTRHYKCDACQHLHMLLMDEDDKTIATAVIDRQTLVHMLSVIDGEPTHSVDHSEHRH
jgi:membrane-bound inhibitor of C-type lysozyme